MILKQTEELGFYVPSFFFIKINTDEILKEIDDCSESTQSTFFHEYLHFLQDIYTLFGLRNISNSVNLLYSIYKEAKSDTIRYPITFSDKGIIERQELFRLYFGTNKLSWEPFQIKGFKIEPNNQILGYEELGMVEIETISVGIGVDYFYLGAYCIFESMTYMIEHSIFGKSSAPIFPYKIIDLLIDQFFSDLNLTPELKISICEEALNSGNPGVTLLMILNRLKETGMVFYNPEEFHIYSHRQFFLEDERKVKSSLLFAIESETNKSQSNLKVYFPDDGIIKINNWIDYIFDYIKSLRKSGFHFYELYRNKNRFIELINNLGTPLVSNNSDYFFMNPKIDQADCYIDIFLVIREQMLTTLGIQEFCGLKAKCLNDKPHLINRFCDSAPYENRKRDERCDLTAIMYLWGMK